MTELEYPNFGALLAPFIGQVPEERRPRFLALLERGAAERYRRWAEDLPDHAEGLLACAAREDEIADRVERVFAADDPALEHMRALLPGARDTYYGVFHGLSPWDQLRIQADAERQGANAWRSIAAGVTDGAVLAELRACSALEEESAAYLERLVAAAGG